MIIRPADVAAVYEHTTSLSWDYYLKELLVSFGVDNSLPGKGLHEPGIYQNGHAKKSNGVTNELKYLVHWTESLYRSQFRPGPEFEELSDSILGIIDVSLH